MTVKADTKPHHIGHRSRLRERFIKGGATAVSDYELLEMLLFAANTRGDVKPLAKMLLKHFGSFGKVLRAGVNDLNKLDGVSDAAITALKATEAAAQLLLKEDVSQGPVIQSWTALLDYCRLSMGHKINEEFRLLFLNHKNAMIADEVQNQGTINHTSVYPREVVRRALELGAAAIILVHNHPTGDVTPSQSDIDMTQQIIAASTPLGVKVHDHLIIGKREHFSFKSHGLI